MNIIEHFLDIIAPHLCAGCGVEGTLLCLGCEQQLPALPSRCYRCKRATPNFQTCTDCVKKSDLHAVYARTSYDGLARDIVWGLKFERKSSACAVIGRSMAQALPPLSADCITHVPTANQRIRMRGYDQARLIARQIALLTDSYYAPLLLRVGNQRQVGQKRALRQQQMVGAFLPFQESDIQNKSILLIDDVITTGSTIEAVAAVLKKAGAKRVSTAVFAAA